MIRYLSLFSGIGSFEKALDRIGTEYQLVGFSEIDKYAIKSYCAVHGVDESLNLGDISKIDLGSLPEDIDLITHGSPCQDFSIAGKLAGGDKGSGTRSSLMWCTVDIVERVRPKYVVWENVKNVLSAKNRHNFDGYIQVMEDLGYNSYYKILNAKDFGIPQNRERVFTISIRKDIDTGYEFPEGYKLTKKLKDVLEENVDEKYYLSDKLLAGLIANTEKQKEKGNGFKFEPTDDECIAKAGQRMTDNYIKVIGELDIKGHDCVKRVYGVDGISPTLTDMQGGNRQPKIITHIVPQIVSVRKYNVDTERLLKVLREHKEKIKITNKQLAEKLDIPVTQVEHYFRQDNSFAIPEPSIWLKLKELLKIETEEFDKSIMTFEEKEGVYEKANRIYDTEGLAPTLTQQEEKILEHPVTAVAMRGRYNEQGEVEQKIEISDREIANSITTVQKDSMIGEPCLKIKEATKQGYKEAFEGDGVNISGRMKWQRGNVQKDMCQTIVTSGSERGVVVADDEDLEEYDGFDLRAGECADLGCGLRIRKLTPLECWRLMGFDDEDFDKAQAVPTSNTQLYKQARKLYRCKCTRSNI